MAAADATPVATAPEEEAWEDAAKVEAAIDELLPAQGLEAVTLRKFRRQVASHLGFGKKGLEAKADRVNAMIKQALTKLRPPHGSPAERMAALVQELGEDCADNKQLVHLVTLSRVLPETLAQFADLRDISGMTREEVAACVRQAFDDPLPPGPGQPGRKRQRTDAIVLKVAVFMETHADGDRHFHVAVLLKQPRTWGAAKRTLRVRGGLASHFSCSHTQMWSALRYGFIATLKKPVVDSSPYIWSADESWPNGLVTEGTKAWSCLFEASQRPWNAALWKARSELAQKRKAEGDPAAKKARFAKLDLTAIILDRGLKSKAAILEYSQDHGTEAMQHWVHQNQKKLKEFLGEAIEWGEAREAAAAERRTDWEILCQAAERACPHGDACPYAQTAATFFEANADTLSRTRLAVALRDIIIAGPSKTRRTPMIKGPSNTGKSTLVNPFDQLCGKNTCFTSRI